MGKTLIRVSCIDQRLVVVSPPVIASGGRNEDMVEFEFCPLWAGFSKTAVFYRDAADPYHAVVTDDKCIIPWEVLQTDGFVYFGVFGVKGDITRTSEVIRYRVTAGAITEGTKPSDPTPDIYEQLLGKLSNVESLVAPSDPYSLTGKLVQLDNFEGMPMSAVTRIEPVQAGSGDPSPSNVRPITGHTGAKLTSCGKNLLKPYVVDSQYAAFQSVGDGVYTCNFQGNYILPERFLFKAGTVYTFSLSRVNGTGNNPCIVVRNPSGSSDGQQHNYGSPSAPLTVIFETDTEWDIMIQSQTINGEVTVGDSWAIQIELGSVVTAYEPYQGDTFSASFGQTVYGGTLDWNTGVLTVDRAVYNFTGNEPFSLTSGGIPYFSVTKSAGVIASVVRFDQTSAENGSCSHYKPVSAWSGNACEYMGVTHSFRFTDTRFAAVDDFKAYLAAQKTAGTPVQACCKLAMPTTIQLTPAQLTALQGMNNIFCDAGETTVSGRKDILWLTSGLLQRIQTLESTIATLEAAALSE